MVQGPSGADADWLIGMEFRRLLADMGMEHGDVADALRLNRDFLEELLRGRSPFPATTLSDLCEELGVDLHSVQKMVQENLSSLRRLENTQSNLQDMGELLQRQFEVPPIHSQEALQSPAGTERVTPLGNGSAPITSYKTPEMRRIFQWEA